MNPKIVDAKDATGLEKAAGILAAGGVVAFPTETVYGLGADVFNPRAVARIFEIKKRPAFDPLIVHVADPGDTKKLWKDIPPLAEKLMRGFWPGPLTLVLSKQVEVPDIVTAGLSTVGVRMPRHPAALGLIRRFGKPVAAPSANIFGRTSPTSAEAVAEQLADAPDLILDGGRTEVGVESTVLKIEGDRCVLLRPGGVTVEELSQWVRVEAPASSGEAAPESPGRMKSHYAPETPFYLMGVAPGEFVKTLTRVKDRCLSEGRAWPRIGCLLFQKHPADGVFAEQSVLSARGDLREAASTLFDAMRKLDKMKLDLIIAEDIPESGLGLAIMDRLRKAASGRKATMEIFEHGAHEQKK